MTIEDKHDRRTSVFADYFRKRRKPSKTLAAGVGARGGVDGRLSSSVDRRGYVQLNVRVPLDDKVRALRARAARKQRGEERSDLGDVVVDALHLLFQAEHVD